MNKHHALILQTPLVNWFLFSNLEQSQELREMDTERHITRFRKVVNRILPAFDMGVYIRLNGCIEVSLITEMDKSMYPVNITLEPDTHILFLAPNEFTKLSTIQLTKLFPYYNESYYLTISENSNAVYAESKLCLFDRLYEQSLSNIKKSNYVSALCYEYIKDVKEITRIFDFIQSCIKLLDINPYTYVCCEYYTERESLYWQNFYKQSTVHVEALAKVYESGPRIRIIFETAGATQEHIISPGDVLMFQDNKFVINPKSAKTENEIT